MIYRAYIFFFNEPATTEIYPLSLHDALPVLALRQQARLVFDVRAARADLRAARAEAQEGKAEVRRLAARSEEHTSELQSRQYLVCRLLLEKKKVKRSTCHMS